MPQQDILYVCIRHLSAEPVAAHQVEVPGMQALIADIHLHVGIQPNAPGQDIVADTGLVDLLAGAEQALVQQLLHQ